MNPWRWVDPRVEAVGVEDLQAYFRDRGWKLCPNPNASLLRFEGPLPDAGPAMIQVIPASEQLADYRQRVVELITTLSELENRHPVAILDDILASRRGTDGKNSLTSAGRKKGRQVQQNRNSSRSQGL
jgi:hypothetical protein